MNSDQECEEQRLRETACNCHQRILVPFLVAAAVAFLVLIPLKHPSGEEWWKLAYFTTIECGRNLYLPFLGTVLVFYFAADYAKYVWPILSLYGCSLWFKLVSYYGVWSGVTPWTLWSLPLNSSTQHLVCSTMSAGVCAIFDDLDTIASASNKGAQIWIDDYVWLTVVSLVFVLVESYRWNIGETFGALYALCICTLGVDIALPWFLIHLLYKERAHSHFQDVKQAHPLIGWLYLLLAWMALASWLPNLYDWVMQVGTVAGQLEAGQALAVGARATWGIMGSSFTVGFFAIGHMHLAGSGTRTAIQNWVLRALCVVLICGNVAVAMASVLYFREANVSKSFVSAKSDRRKRWLD